MFTRSFIYLAGVEPVESSDFPERRNSYLCLQGLVKSCCSEGLGKQTPPLQGSLETLLSPLSFTDLLVLSRFEEFVFPLTSSWVFWWAAQAEVCLILF